MNLHSKAMRWTRDLFSAGRDNDEGFTLLELLVVLVIIAILVGLAGPLVLNQFGKAKTDAAEIEVKRLMTNLQFFRVDVGRFPTEEEGLAALLTPPENAAGWEGPYVDNPDNLVDPWGFDYRLVRNGDIIDAEVVSLGADNAEGGTGENQDVSSRN